MNKITSSLAMLLAVAGIAGCAVENRRTPSSTDGADFSVESPANSQMVAANYRAADALLGQSQGKLVPGQPILIATLVNIDSIEQSSTLGRVTSENLSALFSQRGMNVIEMKFRSQVYLKKNEGELLLTREITDVARNHNAQAIVVGTYGISSDTIYVNVKLVRPGDSVILAAYDYTLPLNERTRAMIQKR